MNCLLSSNIIIYDIENSSPNEIEFALKALRLSDSKEEKTFILISNVLSWSANAPKEFKPEEDSKELENLFEVEADEQNPSKKH